MSRAKCSKCLNVSKPRRLIPPQRTRYFTAGKITMFRTRYVHYLLLCCWNFFFPSSIVRDNKTFQHTCVVNENEAACMGRHQLFPGLRSMNRWAELVVIQKGMFFFFFFKMWRIKGFLKGKETLALVRWSNIDAGKLVWTILRIGKRLLAASFAQWLALKSSHAAASSRCSLDL